MAKTLKSYKSLPLVYSCSGCSSAAQLANHIAVNFDRSGVAEMSCIAGVGGGVPSLVETAQSGREIIVLDGCPLHCAKQCLVNQGVEPTYHYTLTKYGVKKRFHTDFNETEAEIISEHIMGDIQRRHIYDDAA